MNHSIEFGRSSWAGANWTTSPGGDYDYDEGCVGGDSDGGGDGGDGGDGGQLRGLSPGFEISAGTRREMPTPSSFAVNQGETVPNNSKTGI